MRVRVCVCACAWLYMHVHMRKGGWRVHAAIIYVADARVNSFISLATPN